VHVNEAKNILTNIVTFLDCVKLFSIIDAPHNNHKIFLEELNKFRKLVNISPAKVDKIIRLPNGEQQIRYKTLRPPILGLTDNKIYLDKITKNNFAIKLNAIYEDLMLEEENEISIFIKVGSGGSCGLKERLHVGSWSKDSGWYWEPF